MNNSVKSIIDCHERNFSYDQSPTLNVKNDIESIVTLVDRNTASPTSALDKAQSNVNQFQELIYPHTTDRYVQNVIDVYSIKFVMANYRIHDNTTRRINFSPSDPTVLNGAAQENSTRVTILDHIHRAKPKQCHDDLKAPNIEINKRLARIKENLADYMKQNLVKNSFTQS